MTITTSATQLPTMLVFDATNIINRTFSAQEGSKNRNAAAKFTASGLKADEVGLSADVQLAGLAHYMALASLNKYFNRFNPDKVVLAFDRSNWRKKYTASEACISGAIYKGTRRQNQTDAQQEAYARFREHISEFEDMARQHTGMVVLAGNLLEADDIIGGLVAKYAATHNIIIISADQDMLQFLRHPTVQLIDPASGNPRSLVDYNMDADFFMFQKCIRGDSGDNVKSAFPKVRMTRITKAYSDPFEYDKLMKEEWTNADGKKMVVGELFQENKLLMDLNSQPDYIKTRIEDTIEDGFANPGKYNNFLFLKFCGKFGLRKVAESLHLYQRLLL